MKKILIIYLIFLIAFISNVFGQLPDAFTYQCVIRDGYGNVIREQNINLQIDIISGSENGVVVFTENQVILSNTEGLVTISVGEVEDLSLMDWANGPYFISIIANEIQQSIKEIASLPFAIVAAKCFEADSTSLDNLTNKPDFSNWDMDSDNDFDGSFNSLKYWSTINNNLYYNEGKVLVGGDDPTVLPDNLMHIHGAVLYNGGPTDTVPGILYYDPAGNGSFRYFNNSGEMKVIGTGTINFEDSDPPEGDVVVISDVIWNNRVCLGNSATSGYDFGNNVFAIASDTIRVYIYDTSNSSQFPSNDWQMRFNDLEVNGKNYFAIFDSTHQSTPFILSAGSGSNTLNVSEEGNLGIDIMPSVDRVVTGGNIVAGSFIGSGNELTGLDGVATDTLENTGSTTIAADTDSNSSGDIVFETNDTVRMRIKPNGFVKIGSGEPECEFDAGGLSCIADGIKVKGDVDANAIFYSVHQETNPGANTLSYDVTNRKNIVFNSSIGNINLNGFQNGVLGQEITIVNISGSSYIQLNNLSGTQIIINPGFQNITLNQFDSATYIYNGTYWFCKNLIK